MASSNDIRNHKEQKSRSVSTQRTINMRKRNQELTDFKVNVDLAYVQRTDEEEDPYNIKEGKFMTPMKTRGDNLGITGAGTYSEKFLKKQGILVENVRL